MLKRISGKAIRLGQAVGSAGAGLGVGEAAVGGQLRPTLHWAGSMQPTPNIVLGSVISSKVLFPSFCKQFALSLVGPASICAGWAPPLRVTRTKLGQDQSPGAGCQQQPPAGPHLPVTSAYNSLGSLLKCVSAPGGFPAQCLQHSLCSLG